uniref:Reverse transcriptase domain-containing protein n=1 Tax=Tanacetum cinerariifolium TaxID=118510 RepID=A0A6L2JXZ4_TANCI|nr:reverse transcriptase domain-containing protein [Tanacetum cinerariifolium]
MSTMANTTPIVTTVTKTANKEKTSKEADAALKANILDFCEEHYEDILPVIMDKSAATRGKKYRNPSERPKMRDRVKYNHEDVFDRLSHRRQSAFDRLSNTYSPTKSGLNEGNPRDRSHSRGCSRRRSSSGRDCPRNRNHPCGIEESYSNTRSSYRTGYRNGYHARNRNRSRSMKIGRESESPLSRGSESGTSDGGHWKTKAKWRKPADEEDLSQKKYVKDPVEIHNNKQKDGETIEEFMERFKIKTGRMKGSPECMRIFGFMHGVNNPELTKRLNEHVPKTVEEMITATTAFIRGETAVASKKKVHTPWKSQDLSKRQTSERRSDFRNQPNERRGSNKFSPLTRTPKEIFAAESGKFKPPPPMVTPVEKRSHNKFCEFHKDKGHSTDECVQLRKQIEELERAGKLSHYIKEIRQGRDQQQTKKKDAPVKDKAATIYMIRPWIVPFQKSIARSNPSAATPLSVSWTPTRAIIKYRWPNKMRKRRLSTPVTDKAFDKKIGRMLEIYVDDLVIKSHTETELLRDIEKTFYTLRKINMKLDPKKCTFGAAEGMFLGYMINPEGIKPCPDKTEAMLQLPSPRTIKEVQSLNGKLASLNRFISKSAEKSLPLFKILKRCIKK